MKNKIKSFFSKHPQSKIKAKELAKELNLKNDHEYAELKFYLHKLQQEEFIVKLGKRYSLNKKTDERLIGKLKIINERGYGFVTLKNHHIKDIFIPGKYLNSAMDGDKVEVKLLTKQYGKNIEGQIVSIIERAHKKIIGTLKKTKSFYFVEPVDEKLPKSIYISKKNLNGAKIGDKVVVGKLEWKSQQFGLEGTVLEILGKAGSYDAEIAAIAREFDLEYKFPKEVTAQSKTLTEIIPKTEIEKRLDLRNEIIFTIDPDDAKDFDDAVSIKKLENGNFLVGVHIADVSYYVKYNSPIFKEAQQRATSVYLVGKVIPMLPEELSTNICSLLPGKDRLTYSVISEITPRGKVVSYQIKKSIINSKRRFTYNEVQEIIDKGEGEFAKEINLLNKLAKTLRQKRIKKGSINFHTPEVEFKLDKNGVPIDVKIKEIKESHNLIEEFMLLANQIIATHINLDKKNRSPFIYRVHDQPDKEKIEEFSRFVKSLGYSFDPKAVNNSKQFQILLDQVKGTEEEGVINEIAIRSMAKAIYSTKNIGHYGLGFKYYTHFTSPIRRFPDLMVHKLIYNYVENVKEKNFSLEELEKICNHSSEKERSATEAERLSIKLKQIEFLKNKIGEEFNAIVSGITNFGIFVELSHTLAEGLVRLKDINDDFYVFDEKNYAVYGKRTGKRIRLGDKVNVKLIRVNETKREIDFALV
ncbi:ribonuclease R [Melioribacteraceae bacterium 4301-Me]|uniref:ribonuclease R n=1 Tax=Pyranulibacter aquaticus TaxID=3163344 RepID=UPI0035998A48